MFRPKVKSSTPFALLVFAFLWYFMKAMMTSAASGASMAVVEGVAVGPSVLTRFLAISPVFVYLYAWAVHGVVKRIGYSNDSIRQAVNTTFEMHCCWFFGCALIGLLYARPLPAFQETLAGIVIFSVGDWLSVILLIVFHANWIRKLRPSSPELPTVN